MDAKPLRIDRPHCVPTATAIGTAACSREDLGCIEDLERELAAAPDDLNSRIRVARAFHAMGRRDAALAEIRRVINVCDTWAPAWLALADLLVDFGRYAKAAAAYRRARAVDEHRPALGLARRAWHEGNAREAEQRYQAILQRDLTHVGALCGLAGVHLSAGRLSDSERLLVHALKHCAYFPAALRLLGQTYLQAGRLPEAEAAIRRSLDIEPRNEQNWLALATICGRLMQPEAALAAYRAAERINPQWPLVHLSIGHVLKTLGRRAECERVYHECLEQDPTSGEAFWSLADLKNYVFSDAEIAAMEALVARPAGDDINLAALHFALGRAREQRDEYAPAFEHYAAGNRLRRTATPFDYGAFESKCERLIARLDREFFAANRDSGIADESPIFIVGLPRSGSTLVEQILASHSRVEGTMELPNILYYVQEFEQLGVDGDAYPESLGLAPRAVLEALGRRYLNETRPLRQGRARFIDKLPNNFMHIGLIHAMLPRAAIIDVRRHPMDAGFSCFKQCFAAGQTFTYDLEGLGRYYRQYLAVMDHWDDVLPGKVLHVSYEELVRTPEPMIRRLLAHCGLGFEAQCLRFHETQRAIRTASSEQVRRPMNAAGIGYWRRFERELEPLRLSLGDFLERFPTLDQASRTRMQSAALARAKPALTPRVVLSCAIGAVLYAGVAARAMAAATADDGLEEVVVTARRRAENVQDVPQNIDVLTAQNLKDLSVLRLEDVIALSPSISFISSGPGGQRITIRGASDGSSPNYGSSNESTVGYLVDDLALDHYGHNPDLHLYDIARIEVLNGPQGTLFGPSALAGAVRIITNKPDPNAFSAGADVDGGVVSGGGKNGTYEGYVNLPLVDGVSALRISAFSEHDGGYIDNLLSTRTWSVDGITSTNAAWAGNNFNTRNSYGGRIALLQNIGENWRVLLSGNYQQQIYHGSWEDDPTLAGLREDREFAPSGGYNYARFLELHVEGDVGIADLVYIGGISSLASARHYNFSEYSQYSSYAGFVQPLTCVTDPTSGPGNHGCGAPYMYGLPNGTIKRFSNEIRLQSKPGRVHWTLGVYSEKLRNPFNAALHLPNINFNGAPAQHAIVAYDNKAMPVAGDYYSAYYVDNYNEATEFGDVTFDLDDLWSIEGGVQHFHSAVAEAQVYATYFYYPRYSEYHRASSNKTNLKAGINFKPRPHSLLYFSFAQGYREGGFNYVPSGSKAGVPLKFDPDTLNNYELGFKTEEFGGRLIWNTAAYLMLWKDYQTTVSIAGPPHSFQANIGDARIAGVESTVEWVPLDGLHLSFSGSYNDARLRSNEYQNPSFMVLPGERLSEAPLFNCSGVARYERHIANESAYAQIDVEHKGSMWNALQIDKRILQPEYSLINLRVGFGNTAGVWRAEGYVTNVANKRAVVYADTTSYDYYPGISTPQLATPPRVVGLRVSYNLKK
jgi:outer membrane receptor protein involved in Fe transport/tetratricopeptide (TPR) repeat protein